MNKLTSVFATVAGLTFGTLASCQQANTSSNAQLASPNESDRNEKDLLKVLWPALKSSGKAGRVYYRAICQKDDQFPVAFPKFNVKTPRQGKVGLAAVRDMFRNDQSASVTEDEPGLIRITIGTFPDAILHTRIASLTLSPVPQYNPEVAVMAIEHTPEVQAAMHRLEIRLPERVLNLLVGGPVRGGVHVPEQMKHVTMDQALDVIATTFKGMVFYGACTQPRLYDIRFTGGVYFDERWLATGDGQ